mmetsp:Transcript_7844/g.19141  ORF Transcript_7844/g.19141 Transcript_7844/m.19141 type:complete len:224 (-) Transcript_7844:1558-2229(-)
MSAAAPHRNPLHAAGNGHASLRVPVVLLVGVLARRLLLLHHLLPPLPLPLKLELDLVPLEVHGVLLPLVQVLARSSHKVPPQPLAHCPYDVAVRLKLPHLPPLTRGHLPLRLGLDREIRVVVGLPESRHQLIDAVCDGPFCVELHRQLLSLPFETEDSLSKDLHGAPPRRLLVLKEHLEPHELLRGLLGVVLDQLQLLGNQRLRFLGGCWLGGLCLLLNLFNA